MVTKSKIRCNFALGNSLAAFERANSGEQVQRQLPVYGGQFLEVIFVWDFLLAMPKSRRWTAKPEEVKTVLIVLGIVLVLWTLWCLLKAWFEDMERREHMRNEMRKGLPRDKWNDPEAYGVYSWDRSVRKRHNKRIREEFRSLKKRKR